MNDRDQTFGQENAADFASGSKGKTHFGNLKNSMKRLIIPIPLACLLLVGCRNLIEPSKGRTDLDTQQIKTTEGISKSIQSLELSVTKNEEESKKRIDGLEKEGAARAEQLKQINAEIDAKGKRLEEIVNGIMNTTATAFGGSAGGSLATSIASKLMGKEAATDIAGLRGDVAKLDTKNAETKKEFTDKLADNQKEIVALKEQLLKSPADQDRFRAEFLKVAKENGISPTEVAKLESSSTNQLMGLLGSGGILGALALQALRRTYGKSRASEDVDKLKEDVDKMKTALPTEPSNKP